MPKAMPTAKSYSLALSKEIRHAKAMAMTLILATLQKLHVVIKKKHIARRAD